MKTNKIIAIALASAIAASLSACGAKAADSQQAASSVAASSSTDTNNAVYYSAGLDDTGYFTGLKASDYVTLPTDLDKLVISADDVVVDSTTIDTDMDNLKTNYGSLSEVTDRAAATGDTVNIDYKGTVDGVEFTGGTSTDYDIVLGSGNFIDGFEDQIVGHSKGDQFTVTVTFPDGYGTTTDSSGNEIDLSNKEAQFAVTLNSISVSELSDADVASAFGDTYTMKDGSKVTTVAQAKQYFEEQEKIAAQDDFVANYLSSNSTVKDLPDSLMETQKQASEAYVQSIAAQNSTTEEEILSQQGYASFDEYWEKDASAVTDAIKLAIIIQAYAEQNNITVTEDAIKSVYGDNYAQYSAYYGAGYVAQTTMKTLVVDSILSTATLT